MQRWSGAKNYFKQMMMSTATGQKKFSKWLMVVVVCLGTSWANAQPKLYQSIAGIRFQRPNASLPDDTLRSPFGAGIFQPQVSSIDLNGDGRLDFMIFEPQDNRILTYINQGYENFTYAPEYEAYFPYMEYWALARDFNGDGKMDLFCFSSITAGMDIYLNEGIVNKGPKFRKIYTRLSFTDQGFDQNIYSGTGDIPQIEDLNGDGRIDILCMDVTQNRANLFLNTSKTMGYPADSLKFRLADRCFGKFETTFADTMTLGKGCGYQGPRGKAHGSMSLLSKDLDGDGDRDLLSSNLYFSQFVWMQNGQKQFGRDVDTMIQQKRGWPFNTNTIYIDLYPVAFPCDFNNDGKEDLILSPQANGDSNDTGSIWLMPNVGTNAQPQYTLSSKNFLQDEVIWPARRSSPCLWDFDGDGDKDLIIATKGNNSNAYLSDKLVLWKNSAGSNGTRLFSQVADNIGNMDSDDRYQMNCAAGDLNGDGKEDLLVGAFDGTITGWKNLGGPNPSIQKDNNLSLGLQVNGGAFPLLFDVDSDGLMDALIGNSTGEIVYFRNTGTTTLPQWQKMNDTFGNVHVNDSFFEYVYDINSGDIIDSIKRKQTSAYTSIAIADIDNDGKQDLITGNVSGTLRWYSDVRSGVSQPLTRKEKLIWNQMLGIYEDKKLGSLTTLAAADLNGDGLPEVIVGSFKGGLAIFGSRYQPVIASVAKAQNATQQKINIYPNPASNSVQLDLSNLQPGTLRIYDVAGRLMSIENIIAPTGQYTIRLTSWPSGVYMLQFINNSGTYIGRLVKAE